MENVLPIALDKNSNFAQRESPYDAFGWEPPAYEVAQEALWRETIFNRSQVPSRSGSRAGSRGGSRGGSRVSTPASVPQIRQPRFFIGKENNQPRSTAISSPHFFFSPTASVTSEKDCAHASIMHSIRSPQAQRAPKYMLRGLPAKEHAAEKKGAGETKANDDCADYVRMPKIPYRSRPNPLIVMLSSYRKSKGMSPNISRGSSPAAPPGVHEEDHLHPAVCEDFSSNSHSTSRMASQAKSRADSPASQSRASSKKDAAWLYYHTQGHESKFVAVKGALLQDVEEIPLEMLRKPLRKREMEAKNALIAENSSPSKYPPRSPSPDGVHKRRQMDAEVHAASAPKLQARIWKEFKEAYRSADATYPARIQQMRRLKGETEMRKSPPKDRKRFSALGVKVAPAPVCYPQVASLSSLEPAPNPAEMEDPKLDAHIYEPATLATSIYEPATSASSFNPSQTTSFGRFDDLLPQEVMEQAHQRAIKASASPHLQLASNVLCDPGVEGELRPHTAQNILVEAECSTEMSKSSPLPKSISNDLL
ncbi:hypothetical protein CYMTET_13673 [Cymbomonas tetramitiformis]|uniref:Uncharacterized protein n=1 Tax=Cymbomonas tetramitiformis TaxID=36881 RepID=A0AAE0GHL7_9CHLO|nr:hypothetical protein CYMTET_13673 [Cymbomonas tetramitiformis]